MSHNQPVYDPLPLTGDDAHANALYNAPPSPAANQTAFTPLMGNNDLPRDDTFIPPGAAQPRFMGQHDGGGGGMRGSFAESQRSSARGGSEYGSVYALNDTHTSRYQDDPNGEHVPMSPVGGSRYMQEKENAYAAPRQKSRKKVFIIGAIVAAILVALAVIIPLYFTVIRKDDKVGGSTGGSKNDDGNDPKATDKPGKDNDSKSRAVVTGGDGSIVTLEDGTTFVYRNQHGGYWYYDPNDPFNNGARAQSWNPALNETFNYGIDKIRGVNVGGWLVTEPFISPALYEKYINVPAVDEWELSIAMRADTSSGGGINQMEEHYKTFITEQDFAEIAAAGLNYVRIPIGWWAIETRGDEPYLEGVSWTYFLKAIKWCRKYGLRINLDLHAVPGSQNGWNHSGRFGTIGFLHGPMGYANAQRTLDVIRVLAEFVSQPQYKDVVTMFGIMNEPLGDPMSFDALSRFYMEAYHIVRRAGGTGEGNGPWISLHDGFFTRDMWANVFPNGDRLSIDSHPYICFGDQSNAPMSSYATRPCSTWGRLVNTSMSAFGLTNAGEFSNAVTDCGLFLNGVNLGTRYQGEYRGYETRVGDCAEWTNWQAYTPQMKADIRQFALASMDALQHFFFWTWKIGDSLTSGRVETPAWSYQLGLKEGWMPTDPRDAEGVCGNTDPWEPPLAAWQTGGAGAGDIPAAVTDALAWPPASIRNGGAINAVPSYTQTGPIPTLSALPITAGPNETMTRSANVGNGWNNPDDNSGYVAEIPGCVYQDPWIDPGSAPPSPLCNAVNRRNPIPAPLITPPPS